MDRRQLEKLGRHLREIGYCRRQIVERIFDEIIDNDQAPSKQLYEELSFMADQEIEIIQKQKQMFDQELGRM